MSTIIFCLISLLYFYPNSFSIHCTPCPCLYMFPYLICIGASQLSSILACDNLCRRRYIVSSVLGKDILQRRLGPTCGNAHSRGHIVIDYVVCGRRLLHLNHLHFQCDGLQNLLFNILFLSSDAALILCFMLTSCCACSSKRTGHTWLVIPFSACVCLQHQRNRLAFKGVELSILFVYFCLFEQSHSHVSIFVIEKRYLVYPLFLCSFLMIYTFLGIYLGFLLLCFCFYMVRPLIAILLYNTRRKEK